MVQIFNLRTLEVEHDLELIWRLAKDLYLPECWPYGHLKGPKIENEAWKNNVLLSLRPMDESLRQHEQVYKYSFTISKYVLLKPSKYLANAILEQNILLLRFL